jgi:hypothetical protein
MSVIDGCTADVSYATAGLLDFGRIRLKSNVEQGTWAASVSIVLHPAVEPFEHRFVPLD